MIKDFFVFIFFWFLILLVLYYVLLIAFSTDSVVSNGVAQWLMHFSAWTRPLVFALVLAVIIFCLLVLINLAFIIRIFSLWWNGGLTAEGDGLYLKNEQCRVVLYWNRKIVCYKKYKVLFEINIEDMKINRDYCFLYNPLSSVYINFYTLFFYIAGNGFNASANAEDVLNISCRYCRYFLPKKDMFSSEITEIIKVKQDIEKEKLDINNASAEEINKLPGINIVMSKKLIKKREELGGFKTVEDVIIYLRVKPHMAEILRDLICVKKMKILKAFRKHDDRRIDL